MKMNPTARRHHFLPQAYIAAFTKTGSKEDKFFVFDTSTGKSFCTSPLNVAVKRDFNRIDIDDMPIDALEQNLSSFEGQVIKVIQKIIKSEEYPNDEDLNWVLNFLCLVAIRNPKLRKSFNDAQEQTLNKIGDILVSDKKIWDNYMKKIRESGTIINENVSFEEMKDFIENRKYVVKFHPSHNLDVEFETFDKILPMLGQRTWSIIIVPNDGPGFICSDHPVSLAYKNGRSGPIGFALKETEVFFPLGRRIGLYGVFEDPLKSKVKARPINVAIMNLRTFLNAEKHVFSSNGTFNIWYDGKIIEVPSNKKIDK
ncbi:MAG: DUF4238 domain-containing protein [Pseudomonadota bacterium]